MESLERIRVVQKKVVEGCEEVERKSRDMFLDLFSITQPCAGC